MKWLYRSVFALLIFFALLYVSQECISCKRPQPITKEKETYIGVWQARSGFKVNIKASGTADVYEHNLPHTPDNMKLIIGIAPDYASDMLVGFGDDNILIISKPTVRAREYKIDRNPYLDGDTIKMILNGVVLIKQR